MYVVSAGHDSGYVRPIYAGESYEDAVNAAHEFFESYGFVVRDGRPYDSGNEDGGQGGYRVFSEVRMEGDKVIAFTHAHGEGPVLTLDEV